MKYLISSILSLVVVVSLSSFTSVTSYSELTQWEKLGSKKVNFKLDRDVLHVGLKEGRFSKLKLAVTGGSLNMHKMKIEYMNGQVENVALKHKFSQRSTSRVIDIDGRRRIIKNITFWYDTKNRSKKKATLTVLGK